MYSLVIFSLQLTISIIQEQCKGTVKGIKIFQKDLMAYGGQETKLESSLFPDKI